MENIIFTTLPTESKALALVSQLGELETLGDIIIYNVAVLQKEEGDRFRLVSQQGASPADLPATGAITGTLIGALAGPLGMGIGALLGMMTGSVDEDQQEGLQDHIVREKVAGMHTGEYAVILDVEEDDPVILDSYLKDAGAYTRTPVAQEWDAFDQEQLAIQDQEIADEEQRWKEAVGEEKAAIGARIETLKAKRIAASEKAKEKLHLSIKSLQEKLHHLEEKIKNSNEKGRQKMTVAIADLKQQLLKLSGQLSYAFSS